MSNQFGRNIRLSIFGESHQSHVGIVIDGLPAGLVIDEQMMAEMLARRRSDGTVTTARQEADVPQIISGYFNGHTTGAPLTLLFSNDDVRSQDYQPEVLRPSHSDYAAHEKYDGYNDYRGSGHFSGRVTVGLVAAGSICRQILCSHGIQVGSHVIRCREYEDLCFDEKTIVDKIKELNGKAFPVINNEAQLREIILKAKADGDSVGAVMETAVTGLPVGVGEPFFDSLESQLSHALFSIGGIKGVSFGMGFEMAEHYGSEVNDPWAINDGTVSSLTNNSGGINGGLSNGMPLLINTVFRPTSSIAKKQQTVDIVKKENTELELKGRHDPAIFVRGAVVIDSMVSFVLLDNLAGIYGQNWLK